MADSDLSPVYIISTDEYEDHPLIVGEGLPSGSVKTSSGCLISSSITYHFKDPDGNPLRQEQILNQYWKEDWVDMLKHKFANVTGKQSFPKMLRNLL